MTTTDEALVEVVARALAKSQGLDFDEVCGVDADPDEGYCDSGTCISAYWEEHDAEQARRWYTHMARAAIAAMPPAPQWRTIDSAPRDGAEEVQLWGAEEWAPKARWCGVKKHWYEKYWDADWQCYSKNVIYRPTHWMPLPTPPAGDEQ